MGNKIIVRDCVMELNGDFPLYKIPKEYLEEGYILKPSWDGFNVEIILKREETNEEFNLRIAKEKIDLEIQYQEYLKLKAKFENYESI